jgi:hypothetical protein
VTEERIGPSKVRGPIVDRPSSVVSGFSRTAEGALHEAAWRREPIGGRNAHSYVYEANILGPSGAINHQPVVLGTVGF